ncbi:MAG: universal stress protein [Chloroflexota bacterium]|nr:universal stress protein [Candidatus Limnocylindria bacterium]
MRWPLGTTITVLHVDPLVDESVARLAAVGADLIAVGSRGRTGLARFLLGSVARNVLYNAPVSVLIVREQVAAAVAT